MAPLGRWVALRPRSRISPGRSGDTAGIPRAPAAIGHRGFVLLALLLSLGCLYPQPRVWPALEAAASSEFILPQPLRLLPPLPCSPPIPPSAQLWGPSSSPEISSYPAVF